ncbi:Glycoside hydrolase family 114 protein [Mycena venus]|uniref:alpha-galactosidase n=1 Tax=Mycena venus TaxID=2733690 RepID=A0A8H6XY81_9AGAR|nr:Glycoside hydrolase family 114 protein [Mycena venus]
MRSTFSAGFMILVTLSVSAASHFTKRAVTLPPVNGKFDYQIGGAYPPAADVRVVDRDRSDSPVPGKYNICYINAFQTQPDEADFWFNNPANAALVLHKSNGDPFEDPDFEGEFLLDTRTESNRQAIATILNGWIDDCHSKGFDAIEPDNLDTFTRSNHLLTAAENLALAKLFTDHAHSLGLAVAQKERWRRTWNERKVNRWV